MKIFVYLTLTAFALLLNAHAFAQEINAAGAAHIKSIIQHHLDTQQKALSTSQSGSALLFDGDIDVEASETYYSVTLPLISLQHQNGDKTNIGIIALNVIPQKQAGLYKMTLATPSTISRYNAAGEEITKLSIGGQNTGGLWDERIKSFSKLNAVYNDIVIEDKQRGTPLAALSKLQITHDLEKSENGLWSGPVSFTAQGATIASRHSENISLANITARFALQGFSPSLQKQSIPDNADIAITLNDLQSHDLKLNTLGMKFNYSGADTDFANANFELTFDAPPAVNASELLPQSGSIKLLHKNIPAASLKNIIENSANGDAKLLGLSLLLKVPAILAQVGSTLEFKDTSIKNNIYNIGLNSVIRADITAANSATAKGTLRFAGLDKTLSLVQVEAGKTTFIRPLARFLERLKQLARIETDTEDGFLHLFDFEVNQSGAFLVNGQNASHIFKNETPNDPL